MNLILIYSVDEETQADLTCSCATDSHRKVDNDGRQASTRFWVPPHMCSHGGQMMDDNEDEDNINVVFSCFEFQICLKLYILNI